MLLAGWYLRPTKGLQSSKVYRKDDVVYWLGTRFCISISIVMAWHWCVRKMADRVRVINILQIYLYLPLCSILVLSVWCILQMRRGCRFSALSIIHNRVIRFFICCGQNIAWSGSLSIRCLPAIVETELFHACRNDNQ